MGAETAPRRELEAGTPRGELAPYLGEAELRQGDLAEASYWLAAADFAPRVPAHGFHMLGRMRIREGDLAGAGQAFDRALGGRP